jgi:hypothetical protein
MATPIEYTFLGYWGTMAMKALALLFYSWRAVLSIPLCILFFVALFNRQIAEHWSEKWRGVSPWWSVAFIGGLLLWGIMWTIYERDREIFGAYKTAKDRAVKAEQQITIAAPEFYLIGKDGGRISNS